uniref:Uncharacterized protein n=1 Tax=Arundo donax TaxID=35708 RepID=A0A0A9FXW0_ARUDO
MFSTHFWKLLRKLYINLFSFCCLFSCKVDY